MVGCLAYWLSAWIKDGMKDKFMSIAVQPKEEVRKSQTSAACPQRH